MEDVVKRFVLLLAMFALLVSGCAKISGPYYLKNQKYKEGIKTFSEKFQDDPDDAESAYYVGRYYLALKSLKKPGLIFQLPFALTLKISIIFSGPV